MTHLGVLLNCNIKIDSKSSIDPNVKESDVRFHSLLDHDHNSLEMNHSEIELAPRKLESTPSAVINDCEEYSDIKPNMTDLLGTSLDEQAFPSQLRERVETISGISSEQNQTPVTQVKSEISPTSSHQAHGGEEEEEDEEGKEPYSMHLKMKTKGGEMICAHGVHIDHCVDSGKNDLGVDAADKPLLGCNSTSGTNIIRAKKSSLSPGRRGRRKRKVQNTDVISKMEDHFEGVKMECLHATDTDILSQEINQQLGESIKMETLDDNSFTGDSNKGYLCQVCDSAFSSSLLLESHVHTNHTNGHYALDNNNSNVLKHFHQPCDEKNTITKVKHRCEECGKTFQWHSHLLKHLTIHSEDKPFQCSECQKFFSRIDHLQGHMRRHAGEKPFQCNICGKRFFDRVSLAGHTRTHTGEKPFLCGVCHKGFNDMRYLKRHMRTHTGENPYECDECDESFIDSRSLTRHKRKHTGEKPFHCDECDKSFLDGCSLIRHKKTHSGEKPYICNVCEKCFNDVHNLKRHQRIHTGVKAWKCEDCEMRFWCNSDLKKHMRTHTGEKSAKFKCEECGKGFSRKIQLQTHMKMHSGES